MNKTLRSSLLVCLSLRGQAVHQSIQEMYSNDRTVGTITHGLVSLASQGRVVLAPVTATDGVIGICHGGCGVDGSVQVTTAGIEGCFFDGATTVGDWVQISSSTASYCHDSGSAIRPTSGQVIGLVLSTNSSAGIYGVQLQLSGSGGSGGGVSTSIFYNYFPGGVCLAPNAGFGFNIPAANAPNPACIASGSTVLAVLQFTAATTNQSIQGNFELPVGWTAASLALEASVRSTDSTHASTLNVSTVCVGAAAIDNPTFNTAQALTITAAAGSARTTGSLSTVTTTGCSAGNLLFWKIVADTTNLTGTLDLIGLRFGVGRTL
jgi:hypothetical protein